MGLINTIQTKTEQARAKERIRPLLESRMMRDILLEISQRGTEKLDPQSVPLDQRPLASKTRRRVRHRWVAAERYPGNIARRDRHRALCWQRRGQVPLRRLQL